MKNIGLIIVMSASVFAVNCGREGSDALSTLKDLPMITVTSPAFQNGQPIPEKYTGDGDDVSPPLAWSGVPDGTKELALICDDPDAPSGTWVHWVVYNIPPDTTGFKEGDPGKVTQGKNDFDHNAYGGPAPPSGVHHYHFKVYALDAPVELKPGATKKQLADAIAGHVIAWGELVGTCEAK